MMLSQLAARARRLRPDTLAILGLLAVVLLLFSNTIIPLWSLVYAGDFTENYAFELAARSGLAHGGLPLWNVYFVEPLIGNPQSELLYPGMALLRWIPLPQAFGWELGLHILAAGAGVYLLLRDLGARRSAAWLGAVGYMLSGSIMEHLIGGHVAMVNVTAWLGWIILSYRRLLATRRWRWFVATIASVAGLVLTGHVPWVLISLLMVVACGLFMMGGEASRRDWPALRRSLLASVGVAAAAGLVLAVYLLPVAEYLGLSPRSAGLSYSAATEYSLTPDQLLTLPASQARIAAGGPVTAADETLAYTGLLALGLAVLALTSPEGSQRAWARLLAGMAIVALILSLGGYTPLYWPVYSITTFMRDPSRYLLVWAFCLPLLSGLGLESALRRAELAQRGLGWVLWVGLGLAAAVMIAAVAIGPVARVGAVIVAVIALIVWAAALAARRWLGDRPWGWLMAAAMLVDVFAYTWLLAAPGVMNSIPYYDLFFKPEANPYLAFHADPAAVRLWGGDGGEPWAVAPAFGLPVIGREIQVTSRYVADLIGPSAHEALLSAAGYQVLNDDTPPPPGATVLARSGQRSLVELAGNLPRVYATSAVRVVKTPQRSLKIVTGAQFDPLRQTVVLDPDGVFDAAGFAEDAPASGADVQLITYEADTISARVTAAQRVMVVFVEPYYPGWEASIDRQPAPIWQVNHAFRGVVVPAGDHTVTLAYQPGSVRTGLWISGAALAALALVSLWRLRRRA